jgi:hypothetical protein
VRDLSERGRAAPMLMVAAGLIGAAKVGAHTLLPKLTPTVTFQMGRICAARIAEDHGC